MAWLSRSGSARSIPIMATLFMSGYADYTAESIPRLRTGFLQKPFTPDMVARKVRDLLDTVDAVVPEDPAAAPTARASG